MALVHQYKLQVYRELKRDIGFEKYLENVKCAPSRLFLKLHSGTHGLFEELGRHAKGRVSHRSVLIVGLVSSQLSRFFLNLHHISPGD